MSFDPKKLAVIQNAAAYITLCRNNSNNDAGRCYDKAMFGMNKEICPNTPIFTPTEITCLSSKLQNNQLTVSNFSDNNVIKNIYSQCIAPATPAPNSNSNSNSFNFNYNNADSDSDSDNSNSNSNSNSCNCNGN